jgi:predicted O-linked N-acetylglucosamine transferase (SPINDLY family)
MTFDPVSKILGSRLRRDKYSYNKDEPVTEIPGYSRRELNIEYSKRIRQKLPQRESQRVIEWQKKNPEKVKESQKRYKERNREHLKEYMREYMKTYYKKHPETIKRYATGWQKKHPEKTREYSRRYYQKKKI